MSIFPVASDSVNLDTAQVETTDVWANGFRLNPVTGGVRAAFSNTVSTYNQGVPLDSSGVVCLVDSTASFPSATWNNGIPLSNQKVCLSSAASSTYSNGLPMAANGGLGGLLVPSMSLYFLSTASLDSRITFTRADAVTCATYFDSTGRLQTAAANVARFDYDPATPAGVTGGELFANGGFDSDTAWTKSAGWSISGGSAIATNASATSLFQNVLTVGKTYRITFTVVSISSGGFIPFLGGGSLGTPVTVPGTYTYTAICTSNGNSGLSTSASTNGVVDSLSVQEVTFTPRGLLIEESRQNLLLQSRDMTQAAWTKTDVTPARTQVGIDGVANTACLMTEGSAGTALLYQNAAAVTAGSTITVSVVLKRGNTDWVRLSVSEISGTDGARGWFNLNTGAKGSTAAVGAGSAITSTIASLGGGWYRCTVTVLPNGTYTLPTVYVASASADASNTRVSGATYIVDCAQLEVGAFATSIIPTTTTALTRAADSARMTGTNFSSWFNASAGTFYAEALTLASSIRGVMSVNDNTSNNKMDVRIGQANAAYASVAGVGVWSIGTGPSAGSVSKEAFAYQSANNAVSVNGSAVSTSAQATIPTVSQLQIGAIDGSAAIYLNGWIRRLTYYPTRLANATLQALTA